MAFPASTTTTEQVTEQVERLLVVMDNEDYSASDLMERVGLRHRPTFLCNYLQPALDNGFIEMTVPDKPKSRLQKYRLSNQGRLAKQP